ncbi:MAG: GTPase RsgA, partial [Symbiobacteriaceae bacterium]|nr:GTPase RsgA [Symbiobacteriaceae bacterium]
QVMAVRDIRAEGSRGRHTTTHRQLFMLPSGAMIIDTPGMRELGLFDADESITIGFPKIETLLEQCRFRDCTHRSEPGCAILEALADGSLAEEEWQLYREQKRETRYVEDRSAYLREKRATGKQIALFSRHHSKKR